jgi:DNA-3-methyladenine glycosylase II
MRIAYRSDSEIARSLIQKDPLIEPIFKATDQVVYETDEDLFQSLVSTIVAQQLSGKVAETIYSRIQNYFSGHISPEAVIEAPEDALRALGLSFRKIAYMKSLAECVQTGKVDFSDIDHMGDDAVKEMLIQVKGLGYWSAEMFLIFSLGRPNVFSCRDLGIRKALEKLTHQEITPEAAEEMSEKWHPHKSMVTLYLWKYLEKSDS